MCLDLNYDADLIYNRTNIWTNRKTLFDPPTRLLQDLSLHAWMSFLNWNKHSLNVEKNGWWLIRHNDVRVLFLCFHFFTLPTEPLWPVWVPSTLPFQLRLSLSVLHWLIVSACLPLLKPSWSKFRFSATESAGLFALLFASATYFRSKGRKKFKHMPYLITPLSLSVSVNTKDDASLRGTRFWLTLKQQNSSNFTLKIFTIVC